MLFTNLLKSKTFCFFKDIAVVGLLCFTFIAYLNVFPLSVEGIGGEEEQITAEIEELNQDLQTRRADIEELKEKAEEYRRRIIAERNEGFSLKNQVAVLDTQIAKSKVEIKATEQEIELTKLDIEETQQKITLLTGNIRRQKDKIAEILRTIHQNDETSYLEILLMNDSLADFFNEAKYIESLHTGLHQQLMVLKNAKAELDSKLISLKLKEELLEKEKLALQDQQYKLEDQEKVKLQLLEETQANERKFQSLWQELKQEQDSINSEIVSLERNIREKLTEQEKIEALNSLKGEKFIWPVSQNTITSYFHDPDYPYRYIFEHPAIDIRAKQGTVVKAARSGYVAKVKQDSSCTGQYSYIMIIHANGLSTVYGHMSQMSVKEGEFVVQGQKIGASGGLPGTCGAGRLTTGSHLHFEVRLNGIPVDPLGYLK